MGEIVRFQGAGLPKINVGTFRNQLQQARDQVSVGSGTPFLKLGKSDGVWTYGAEDTEIEEGSLWAINPLSMQTGVVAWPPNNSRLKEPIKKMRAIFDAASPIIDKSRLGEPANGGTWDDCIAFQLQCIGGRDKNGKDIQVEDVGVVIEYQQNSYGGKQAFDELAKALMVQSETSPTLIVPVVELLSSSYDHPKWGTIQKPIFEVVKWVGMDGAETAEEEEQAQGEQAQGEQAQQEQPAPPAGRRGRGAAATAPPVETQPQKQNPPADNGAVDRGAVVRRRRRGS